MVKKAPLTQFVYDKDILAPQNLPYQMFVLVQQMTRRFQEILTPFDLTPLHWGILCCLWTEDGLTPGEIAQRLSQLGGTITVGLNAMQTRRLLRRRQDAKDGRVSRVFITKRGKDLRDVLVPKADDLISTIFARLATREYERFRATISSLRAGMTNDGRGLSPHQGTVGLQRKS